MIKYHRSQISMVALFVCLCMGGLVGLSMCNIVGVLGLEIYGIEPKNDNLFEHGESDEEIMTKIYGAIRDCLLSSQSRSTNLDFQDFLLAPASPPPKHA
jgi:hypothetical protein